MGSNFLSHLHALGGGIVGLSAFPSCLFSVWSCFFTNLDIFWSRAGAACGFWCFRSASARRSSASMIATARAGKSPPIPLGGFVKFFGDDNAASAPDGSASAGEHGCGRAGAKLHVSARV